MAGQGSRGAGEGLEQEGPMGKGGTAKTMGYLRGHTDT